MIIDDEKSLRSVLKYAVEWDKLGLEVAGEASSGIEAINIIDDIKPDIVFVDIKMPFMDGIEFSKIAIKQYPDLKIIVLTAMNEFEYARQCVGIGVCEYLTKPVVRSQVNETLKEIVEKLDQRKNEQPVGVQEPVLENLQKKISSDSSNSISRICDFLKANYTNSEINLTYIANKFNFNASYLSRRFKEDTGMSFVDYLTGCRMEKALELAAKKTPMYRTAQEVGIPDPNYFSKCFKKYKGKSYSDLMKEL